MQIQILLDGVTATGAGEAYAISARRTEFGAIPILVSGITTATVILEGTIASEQEVREGSAIWKPIQGASWSSDIADGLFTAFSHIRANVTSYTAGTITVRALI